MKEIKINKLFHLMYAILMLMPFMLFIFNMLSNFKSGVLLDQTTLNSYFTFFNFSGASLTISNVYSYLVNELFGLSGGYVPLIINFLTYWTCISIIWLIFDLLMYVPNLVHSWIDKAVIS